MVGGDFLSWPRPRMGCSAWDYDDDDNDTIRSLNQIYNVGYYNKEYNVGYCNKKYNVGYYNRKYNLSFPHLYKM